jgi:hypothetical protein
MLAGRRPTWLRAFAAILLVVVAVCPVGMLRAVASTDEGRAPAHTGERLDNALDEDAGRAAGVRASARADEESSEDAHTPERTVVPVVLSAAGEVGRGDTGGTVVRVRVEVCRSESNHLCGDRAPPASV